MKKLYKILICSVALISVSVLFFTGTVSADEYDYERYTFDTLSTTKQYVFYGYANDLPTLINSVENTSFTTLHNSISDRLGVTVLDNYVQYNYVSPYDITASYGYFSMCFFDDRIDTGYDVNLFDRLILNSAYFNYYSLNSEILGYRFSIRPYTSSGTIGAITHSTPWFDSYVLNTEFTSNQLFTYYTPANIFNQTFTGNDLPVQYVICVDFLFQPVLGFEGQLKQFIALDLEKVINGSITAYYQPGIDIPTQPLYPELNTPYYEQPTDDILNQMESLNSALIDKNSLAGNMVTIIDNFSAGLIDVGQGMLKVSTLFAALSDRLPIVSTLVWVSLGFGLFAFIVGIVNNGQNIGRERRNYNRPNYRNNNQHNNQKGG